MRLMNLTFSANIEAADAGRRIISGKIAPFNEVGNTSVGPVIFERGSIKFSSAAKVKLLAQHEQTASGVIGRAQSIHEGVDGMYATFKVSASRDGENMLIKCAEGLLDGLSVGVDVISSKEAKDGTLIVTAATLKEVSVVETPAFDSARIVEVAAAEGEDDAAEQTLEQIEDEQIQKISEAVAVLEEVQKAEKALEETETETEPESEAAMSEASTPTEAAKTESAPITAAAPIYGGATTTPRHGITSMGRYVEHKIKAARGDYESAQWVAHVEDPATITASDTTSTNPAFNPINYLRQVVTNTTFGRPAIDAVNKMAAPASGLQVNIPTVVTAAGGGSNTVPTVDVNVQGDAPSLTAMTSSYTTVTLNRYAGEQIIDLALIERSDPSFMDALALQLENAYKLKTDAVMIAALTAGGVQATGVAGTTAGLMSYIGTEAPAAYKASSYFAQNLLANTDWWSNVISAVDTTGRPLFNTSTPWNSAGDAKPTTIRGSVMGLDFYVDKNVTAGLVDESAFIISPEAALWIESPQAYFSVNLVNSMAVETAIYGYAAGKVLIPGGVRRYNLS